MRVIIVILGSRKNVVWVFSGGVVWGVRCQNGVYVQYVQMRENANEMSEWVNVVLFVIGLCGEW